MSDNIILDLIAVIIERIDALYKATGIFFVVFFFMEFSVSIIIFYEESVALIDMIQSFAFKAKMLNYSKPEFSDTVKL